MSKRAEIKSQFLKFLLLLVFVTENIPCVMRLIDYVVEPLKLHNIQDS